ncbi:MAG TPA: ABC transporter permease, partial [Caulobacterales bacterium]|nr:ABC transporter permease [Caulobacterales bacterium]
MGRAVIALLAETGRFAMFAGRAIASCFSPPLFFGQFGRQCAQIGYFSLPVIGLTAVFIGAALAINIYVGGARFNAEQFVPNIVVLGITRELGPVLAGLMLSGRVSAGIAAEIGTMRVTEQIDALTTLSTDPFRFLVAPRV